MAKLDINWLSDDGKYQYAIDCMQLEIDRLQDRIDKAIEYIDHCIFDYEEYSMVGEDFVIVKNILQVSDKE